MKRLAVYYLDPVENRLRKLVLVNPTSDQQEHYQWIARSVAGGARYRCVGLYDFREEDLTTGRIGPWLSPIMAQPSSIRGFAVEDSDLPVQGELLGGEHR